MEMANKKILIKRSSENGKLPKPNDLVYGELAINYASGSESFSFKNAANKIVTLGMNVKQTIGDDEISPISQKALSSAIKEGINNVTRLVNVPVDKRLVYATLTQDEILSFDTSRYASCFNAFDKGAQIKIIAFNGTTSTHKIVLPVGDIDYICFVKDIEVPVNGYGIITVDYDGTSIYVNAKVESRVEGYAGGEAIVALSNSEGDIKYVKDKNLQTFKNNPENEQYVPIGIVVIPKSHTQIILPDGDPRKGCNIVMSLKPMNYDKPDEGGTSEEQYMCWGSPSIDIDNLTNYNLVNRYADNTQDSGTLTENDYALLPSDRFNGMPSNVCPSIKYFEHDMAENPQSPSPYKVVDGEWLPNEDYYTTGTLSNNALSDFDGPKNTKIITDNVLDSNWKTNSSIDNSDLSTNYPAACCCARFKTVGTSSFVDMLNLRDTDMSNLRDTDMLNRNTGVDTEEYWLQRNVWYMPACGELGYILPNFDVNNKALRNINSVYGSDVAVAVPLSDDGGYWSSSEYSISEARFVGAIRGDVDHNSKNNELYVRAFCALLPRRRLSPF